MIKARWSQINSELFSNNVIKKHLSPLQIRRIIDYGVNNKGDASKLGIPTSCNEGYWTVDSISDYFGASYERLYLRTYRHFGDPRGNNYIRLANKLAANLNRGSGADLFSLWKKC